MVGDNSQFPTSNYVSEHLYRFKMELNVPCSSVNSRFRSNYFPKPFTFGALVHKNIYNERRDNNAYCVIGGAMACPKAA